MIRSSKGRDREATSKAIVEAAESVLAEGGFQAFGVNAIARRANCDKQLIYRYFGGLEGLADAIGADLAARFADHLGHLSATAPPATYGAMIEVLTLQLLDLLRADPVMQKIIAGELAGASPLVDRMVEARGRRLAAWMHEMRGDLAPPAHVDAPAVNAVLIAATQQLALSASASGRFAGLPLRTDEDWRRVRETLVQLIRGVYGRP
ncbi:TetR/AcrR family transcriptional regulator [Phenylobacterium sp.]|uniref:TetR/AcrR family transcriptional regulator n=1 Tax=Phenylobacterium sp. TaxID=1871053 RepID=UPI00262683F7|nr:TetR/AcrR family transcriptional regulator [Phenylobacterium sp.]